MRNRIGKVFAILFMPFLLSLMIVSPVMAKDHEERFISDEQAITVAEQIITGFNEVIATGAESQYENNAVIYKGIENWKNALGEIGGFVEIKDYEISSDAKTVTVKANVIGDKREATISISMNDKEITSIESNVNYPMSERLERAALNTLLGVGTVFGVLIIIIIAISSFTFINRLEHKNHDKESERAIDNTVSQIIENEEKLCLSGEDDAILIAVMSAAIAAYEEDQGMGTGDGYIVRSIKRSR